MVRAILDVGANNGHNGLTLAAANPTFHCFAFEPTPEMVTRIAEKKNDIETQLGRKIRNHTVVQVAVSNYNGTSLFHVAGQADWGCSSLLEFQSDLDKTWPGRSDFKVTHTIEAKVIRLDTFCKQNSITHIGYLHCDTQGCDLDVLRGLGDFRQCLESGVIECASTRHVALYKEQHTLEDTVIEFLRWGFEITKITPNDVHYNELNIHFKNKFFSPFQ